MRRFASVFKRKPDELHTDSSSSRASDSLCSSTDDDHALKQPRWKAWLTPRRVKHSKQPRQQPQRPAPASLSDYVLVDNEHTASATATTTVAVSPFTRMPNAPLFPRSVNSSAALAPSPSLRIHILKSNLAKHPPSFDRPPLLPQSATPASAHPSISLPSDINIPYPPKPTHIYSASPGLRHWITRPCFEERYSVYLPAAHAIQPHPVSASRAVAALEYSEHLDAMVDPDLSLSHSHPTLSASFADSSSQLSHASLPDQLAGSSVTHRPSYATTPSPLRIEHNPTPPSPQPLVQQSKLQAQPVVKPKTDVKRVVRFAEDGDDPDDGLPLHIIRMRKKREEKANFLRAEQARREQQERAERHRLDIERRRQEQEALEKERRRIAKEKEKRDRDAAAYAEAVVASRLRIEAQRAGGVPSSSNSSSSNNLLPPSPSFSSLRESERNKPPSETRRSATMPIPRRDPSDLRINLRVSDPPSPASSRPPSLAHSPASPATFGPNSRPPSTYSSSSEDARQSRRHSAMTSPIPVKPMVVSYPTWSGSNPNLHYMPPVPMFPQYIHDMPLLPPAAPFMKSYDKRSLRGSSPGHSSSASSRRGSINSSTERVNIMNSPASRSTSAIVGKPSYQQQPYPGSPSSSPRRSEFGKDTHQRRSSNDSKPKTPPSSYFASHHQTPRGRQHSTPSPGPQYLVAPNPWTALPTQNGGLPYSMPVSSYTHHVGGGSMGSGRKEGRKMTIS